MNSTRNQLVTFTLDGQRYGLPLSAVDRIVRTVSEWWISARGRLILAPLLWVYAGLACWRMLAANCMLPILALAALVLFLAHL